jgi:gluconate 2-dehydrogenase gamma chain
MRRREFLTLPVIAVSGALLSALARESRRFKVIDGSVRVPLRFFTEAEARVVAAACERIFPGDASGPGATNAGVVIYIDRQLAGPYGRDRYRYAKPPFVESVPEHGYQGRETPREIYRAGCRALGNFADLSGAEQDARLEAIEKTRFFALLRTHTIEGMFSDPVHGGNADLAGWQLIGFPGPQLQYRSHIDAHYGREFRPKPANLQQITGRTIVPSEDEKEVTP